MIRIKTSLSYRRIRRLSWLVLALFVLLAYSLQDTAGSVGYSMVTQGSGTVSSPPVILEEGNVTGVSTIYTNNTSAKVGVEAPVWLSGWGKRVKITIDNNDVDSALYDFPVLVHLSNSSSGRNNEDVSFVFDELQNDGNRKKIAVTTSDGTTQCYVEIERWNDAAEEAWLWVKVPSISSTIDTDLYLYYDSSKSDNAAYVGDKESTPAQNVWDTNFKGVWHLDEDPSGTSPQMKDSTSNTNDGTSYGNMTLGDQVTGEIDGSLSFNGTDGDVRVSNDPTLDTDLNNSFTLDFWFDMHAQVGVTWDGLVEKEDNTTLWSYGIYLNPAGTAIRGAVGHHDNGASVTYTASDMYVSYNTWYHVVMVYNGTYLITYLNGTYTGSVAYNQGVYDGPGSFTIGSASWAGNTEYFNGTIDEVRISDKARSATWIRASFESGRDDLVDFGSEGTNVVDYVDNNTSDIGSPTDIGTHSNFPAQQAGPDATYDTLTEENTGGITKVGTDTSGTGTTLTLSFSHILVSGTARIVIVSIGVENGDTIDVSTVTYGGVTMTLAVERITGTSGFCYLAEIWYILENDLPSDGSQTIEITCSGTAYELEVNGFCSEYTGVTQGAPEATDGASQFSDNTTSNTISPSDDAWVISIAGSGNAGSFTHGQGQVEVLDFQDASSTFAVAELRGASGEISLSSTYSGTVNRLCRVAASWTERARYELDLEVQWASADYAQTNEEICIKTGTFTGSENIQVNVWNTTGSSWDWIMNLTASSWNNVSVSSYLTSSTFTIRFKGGNETSDTTQDSWDIDATLLHVWTSEVTYDYVLRVVNQVADDWTVNLQVYDSSNIDRLSSLNISLHDGASSNQIAVSGGSITKSEGEPYSLPGGLGSTLYISISNLQATTNDTSYLYVYLKIQEPKTSTYILFTITFEIT